MPRTGLHGQIHHGDIPDTVFRPRYRPGRVCPDDISSNPRYRANNHPTTDNGLCTRGWTGNTCGYRYWDTSAVLPMDSQWERDSDGYRAKSQYSECPFCRCRNIPCNGVEPVWASDNRSGAADRPVEGAMEGRGQTGIRWRSVCSVKDKNLWASVCRFLKTISRN